jgi:glycosyltransferase involved in cell wall biosynthesis
MHVHSYHATTALAVLGPRARTVFTPHYHGTRGHSPAADLLHRGFYHVAKVLMRRCDAVICVSRAERELLIRDFPTVADKVCVIPNGVAAEAVRAASPYDDEQPTICCVGRLERYKRVEDIVRAFADVPPPARLVIIGEGPARQELESLVNELELDDRITLTGAIPDGVLHRWLRTASVFVSLSQREAFGMAPLEAAAAGARIILSDIAAHREIAAEYLGSAAVLLSDPAPRALTVEIARQLSLARPPRASVPTWDDVAARTADIYASVTATPAPTVLARNTSHPTKEYT